MSAALINYHREGTGSPLVLVHGIGATWQCWRPVIPGLAARHDVIAIDLPGFGGSVSLGISEPSLEHFAASILALLDHLGIQEFHVVGNSLGGAVAAELCNSGRVLTYTGISAAGHTYGPGAKLTRPLLRASYYGARAFRPAAPVLLRLPLVRVLALWQMLGHPWKVSREYALDLIDGCAIGDGFRPTLAHAIHDAGLPAPRWTGPAQMLWGTRDLILPFSALARWQAAWPGLVGVPMPRLGHVPMQDNPTLIVRQILDLTGAPAPSAIAS